MRTGATRRVPSASLGLLGLLGLLVLPARALSRAVGAPAEVDAGSRSALSAHASEASSAVARSDVAMGCMRWMLIVPGTIALPDSAPTTGAFSVPKVARRPPRPRRA